MSVMSDLEERIALLSPEKREMLLRRLNKQPNASNIRTPIARRNTTNQPVPLSFAQESLWVVDQLAPDSLAYHLPCAIRLQGPLDLSALDESLQALIQRHESLRTTFPLVDDHPAQIVAPTLSLPLDRVDLRSLPEPERNQRTQALLDAELTRPFNLARGPLLRATLILLAEQEAILLLVLHHIIADDWSRALLLRDLSALYAACATRTPSPLADLPIQYTDYTLWQREHLQGQTLDRLLDYWTKQLAGAPAVLELATDHPRPAVQTFRGEYLSFRLPSSLATQLRALSQQEHCSLFMTLLAAFQTLLARYTGRQDIVVGSPIANRTLPESEGLVGYLVNMLVLRAEVSEGLSFRQLLRQVRSTALEAYAHQELPIERLVAALQPERSLSYNPLFQVALVNENPTPPPQEAAGVTFSFLEVTSNGAKFDLTLYLWEEGDHLAGSIEYSTDLFEAATMQRLAGHFQTLLEGIVADPDQPIALLPLLTEPERQRILVDWNATTTPYPQETCLAQLFEAQVARTPHAVAVVDEHTQLTYQELNTRANHLAHHLRSLGVGPESLVGLCLDRSAAMVVGVLAVLKAGGAYVPLDPLFPAERLAFMLEDSQPTVLVTQQHLQLPLPTGNLAVVSLDTDQPLLAAQPGANLPPTATPDQLAYVIYTSGSTGKPKGVQVLQRALVNFLCSMRQQPGLTEHDRLLAVTTLSFDIAGLELYLPLLVGAQIVLVSRETAANGLALARALERSQATVMQATPVTWRLLLEAGWQGSPSLKMLCGGEALPLDLAQQLLARGASLWNLYGPTETTIWSTVRQITAADPLISIGRPIANTQVYVLDAHLQPVPAGVPGELYIGGDGLARGYLHRPDLTAERFVPHPFSAAPNARLYRTGDLARFLPTGDLEHLGRLDHQVKVRGFRIELGEIEATLLQHPTVRQAVVVAREETPGDKRLVAYLIPAEGQDITFKELRSFLKESLPDYMVPSACVMLEAFPQTPNGKIDRKALPPPEARGQAAADGYVAPTVIEHNELIGIWEELLNVRPIGIRDSFFNLGGHSLLAAKLIHRVELVFGKRIPLATFYADPTVEHLAALLAQQEMHPEKPVVTVQAGGDRKPFFYLHGDLVGGAWYCFPLAQRLGADQPFYSIQPYVFTPPVVPPAFEEIAAMHLQTLREIQPEGPYLLGGFCFGGLLAYEMARQLHAQGQRVDLLVLINTTSPSPLSEQLIRSATYRLGALFRLNPRQRVSWFLWVRHIYKFVRFADHRREAKKIAQGGSRAGRVRIILRALFPSAEVLWQNWGAMNSWVLSGYKPGPYVGKITFLWVEEEIADAKKWRKLTTDAAPPEIQIIPGTHLGAITEHLPSLAEHLDRRLREAQAAEENK
jgi:amino acid adenylation domain-containing protein